MNDADTIREAIYFLESGIHQKPREEALAALARLEACEEQALRFISDALEAPGDDEGWLLANDPDNVWCRIVSARDTLRAALAEAAPPEEKT